tara:strand:+ start:226 stop:510 length:285 start_codon:yes stop_codon:yes gene_type:complete
MSKGYWKSKQASLWNNLPEYLQPKILSAVAYVNAVQPDVEKAVKRISTVSKSLSLKEMNWVMHLLSLEKISHMMSTHPDYQNFVAEKEKERTIH